MPFKIVFLPVAKSDIQTAADWYENQQIGLGKKFKAQIVKAIDLIGDPVKGIRVCLYESEQNFLRKISILYLF
jgi:plasmid stabilization system protein ParE